MDGSAKFHLGNTDAVAWLRAMPSESVDLLVTDPPYESLEKHRAIGTTRVRATRRTRAPSLKLVLSDGTELIASREHRFMRADGQLAEAQQLAVGGGLLTRAIRPTPHERGSAVPRAPSVAAVEELDV